MIPSWLLSYSTACFTTPPRSTSRARATASKRSVGHACGGVPALPRKQSRFEIKQNEQGIPTHINCPQGHSVPADLSKRLGSYREHFTPHLCQTCPFHFEERCPVQQGKKALVFPAELHALTGSIGQTATQNEIEQAKQQESHGSH